MNMLVNLYRGAQHRLAVWVMLEMTGAFTGALMEAADVVRNDTKRKWTRSEVVELLERLASDVACAVRDRTELVDAAEADDVYGDA